MHDEQPIFSFHSSLEDNTEKKYDEKITSVISEKAIETRLLWVEEILKTCGIHSDDMDKLENKLEMETNREGIEYLINHLRLCGSIPESYPHDSSVEKFYAKYTDCLLSLAYRQMGFGSFVLKKKCDSADVEVFSDKFNFISDAKAMRMSRTAKNQKDFKVQAMDGWKRGKNYAMVVCPIYQLPTVSSQIYEQAISSNVCIFTYSHLSLILNYSKYESANASQELIHRIFTKIETLEPSKNAHAYWFPINDLILKHSPILKELWAIEKIASSEAINIWKKESFNYLFSEKK